MKTLVHATAFTLAAVAFVSADYASARPDAGRVIYNIQSSTEFPKNSARVVRHTFRLHVPQESKALSHLSIDVPSGLTVSDNISVSDQSGREIDTNVSLNGSQVIIAFTQPIDPGTRLRIDMHNIRRTGVSNAWLYPVSARFVGSNVHIPIGTARFHNH